MKTKILAIAFAALMPFAAFGDGVSYSFADFSYQAGSVDPFDFDGFRFKANYAVNDSWYVHFDYTDASLDPAGDLSDYLIAAGWHNDMWYVTFGLEGIDAGGTSESGYGLDGGFRTMMNENLEVSGHIGYSDLGNFDTFMKYGVGAVWMFKDNMGFSFNYDIWSADAGGDLDEVGLGFRYNFD